MVYLLYRILKGETSVVGWEKNLSWAMICLRAKLVFNQNLVLKLNPQKVRFLKTDTILEIWLKSIFLHFDLEGLNNIISSKQILSRFFKILLKDGINFSMIFFEFSPIEVVLENFAGLFLGQNRILKQNWTLWQVWFWFWFHKT